VTKYLTRTTALGRPTFPPATINRHRNSALFPRILLDPDFLSRPILIVVLMAWAAHPAFCQTTAADRSQPIDFSEVISPILSDKCFHCHGPDAENQDSEFRADTKENLFADLGGYFAVKPGDLAASELHARIHGTDPGEQMPPPDSNRSLTEQEKKLLDDWIAQGAPYEGHWAFETPQRPVVPTQAIANMQGQPGWDEVTIARWSENPIDAFIAGRFIENGLAPSPPADYPTLLRRAALTLTGTLPSDQLQAAIAASPNDQTYRECVDELLDSMDYAERQSLRWLDAARYADTDGYQNDSGRTNWPWRDWVTKAFHENMPFDQFTIEQLAGDMLPDATDSQRLATTFSRNHRQNNEGGALAEEFLIENIIDRVETASTVFLGLTFGCSRCHDHKYDPLSQEEFYQFYSYFNNIGERGIGRGLDANPTMSVISPLAPVSDEVLETYRQTEAQLAAANAGLKKRTSQWISDNEGKDFRVPNWKWTDAKVSDVSLTGSGELIIVEEDIVQYTAAGSTGIAYDLQVDLPTSDTTIAAVRVQAIQDDRFTKPNQLSASVNGNFVLTDVKCFVDGKQISIKNAIASYEQADYPASAAIDSNPNSGWAIHGISSPTADLSLELASSIERNQTPSKLRVVMRFDSNFADHAIGKLRIQTAPPPEVSDEEPQAVNLISDPNVVAILNKPNKQRTDDERKKLDAYYAGIDEPTIAAKAAFSAAEKALHAAGGIPTTVMVMQERAGEPAPAYLLMRGQYDAPDKSKTLTRGVPVALLPSPDTTPPRDRLELAQWLTSPDHPLMARVTVNRFWQDHFGTGLVKTVEDFGLQGETPSHPKLLDWLAVEFVESGWDVKALHRAIVTSQTYRQTSRCTEELQSLDPENRLLARGPRYRTDGFTIRDVALQASGLLVDKPGGPSVYPYQPKGLWESLAAGPGQRYPVGKGDDLYRKSMYSYWKRAVNPPRQIIFDAGGREVCNVRVRRTNTPLQALAMMNDPSFVEAARTLAQRVLEKPDQDDNQRVAEIYRRAMALPIDKKTSSVLLENLAFFRDHFQSRTEEAAKLLTVGDSKRNEALSVVEHAAMTAVAHLVMNQDQFLCVQ
jgi:hypothetical protein